MGKNYLEINPTALYGIALFMAALAFKIVVYFVIKNEGKESYVGKVYSNDKRMNISLLLYLVGIGLSFIQPIMSLVVYLGVALIWFIPDKRIEKALEE